RGRGEYYRRRSRSWRRCGCHCISASRRGEIQPRRPRANLRPRPTAFWRRSDSRRASSELGPSSELLYVNSAYTHAGRDSEVGVGIVVAHGAVAEFRQRVIGLDKRERELAAESMYVDSAAGREREARVCEVADRVVIQSDVRQPEQSVTERLNLPALSQRVLRAE